MGKSEFLEKYRIRIKIFILFGIFVILPFFLFIFIAYRVFWDYTENNLGRSMADTVVSICTQVDFSMDIYENSTMSLYYNGCVDMLEGGNADEEYIKLSLAAGSYSYDEINSIYLVMDDVVYISRQDRYRNFLEWVSPHRQEIVDKGGRCIWYTTDELEYLKKGMRYILCRSLNGKEMKNIGILYYVVDGRMITDVFDKFQLKDASKYLIDANGNTLYSSSGLLEDKEVKREIDLRIQKGQTDGYMIVNTGSDQQLIAYSQMPDTGWIFIGSLSMDTMMQSLGLIKKTVVVVSIIFGVFLVFIFYTFQKSFLKPISELKYAMKRFASGNMGFRMTEEYNGELQSLSRHYNSMAEQISELMHRNEREIQEKNNFKIQALTAQLKPHFIYNTLNTIKWMAIINNQKNIQQVTEALNYILMNASKNKEREYTLREELKLIDQYVVIQKARFMNFEVVSDVDEQTKNCKIIRFLLQPMVENAIIHGFQKGVKECGSIEIKAWTEDDVLHITIRDNGCGFDVEGWRQNAVPQKDHMNIGIGNIEQIILLEYGVKYGIEIESREGEGTTIRYTLPIRKGDGENDKGDYC